MLLSLRLADTMAKLSLSLVRQLCNLVHKTSWLTLLLISCSLRDLLFELRLLRGSRNNRSPLDTSMLSPFTNSACLLQLIVLDATLCSSSIAIFSGCLLINGQTVRSGKQIVAFVLSINFGSVDLAYLLVSLVYVLFSLL